MAQGRSLLVTPELVRERGCSTCRGWQTMADHLVDHSEELEENDEDSYHLDRFDDIDNQFHDDGRGDLDHMRSPL